MPTRRVGLQQRVYSFSSAKIRFYPRHPCSTSTKQFQTNMVWPLAQAGGMRTTCFRPAMLFVTIPTACADRAMYLMATAHTNSSCQKRFTRVTVRGSLMLTVVHFMHPTKHWLLGRVHAVHHEIDHASTRSLAIRTSFETGNVLNNGDRCNVRKEAISRDVESMFRQKVVSRRNEAIDATRCQQSTCSRVSKSISQEYPIVSAKIPQEYRQVCPKIWKS